MTVKNFSSSKPLATVIHCTTCILCRNSNNERFEVKPTIPTLQSLRFTEKIQSLYNDGLAYEVAKGFGHVLKFTKVDCTCNKEKARQAEENHVLLMKANAKNRQLLNV